MQFFMFREAKGQGWTVWSVGASGSKKDCYGWFTTRRSAQSKIESLYARQLAKGA